MKAMKKALALGLALAMVVTAVPVTNAQAATTPKLSATKATIYVGGNSKLLTVSTPSTWKSVKVSAKSGDTSVATVKTASKRVRVTAVKAGTAKVTVKVTGTKSGKKVTKSLSASITVKNPATRIKIDGKSVKKPVVTVGSKTVLTAVSAPKNSPVTFKSSDETVATVSADGTLTALKKGTVNIALTNELGGKYVINVTVKEFALQSVKQTKYNTIEAVIAGNTKAIKNTDIVVTNTATKATYPVSGLSVDANDATKVTITTFGSMVDGKVYTVALDGVAKEFTATTNEVKDVAVAPLEIVSGNDGEVILGQTLGDNGVVLSESKINANANNVTFTVSTTEGYVNQDKLVLPKTGSKANAEITYHTYKYENGAEVGVISKKFEIVAVDAKPVTISGFAYTIGTIAPDWTKVTPKTQVAIGDNNMKAFFNFVDSNKNVVTDQYVVETSDNTTLLVGNESIKDGVTVVGLKEGNAYINVKDLKGNFVTSLPVTVVAARKLGRVELGSTNITVATTGVTTVDIPVKAFDQYGDELKNGVTTTHALVNNATGTEPTWTDMTSGSGKFTIDASSATVGTYQYRITVNGPAFSSQLVGFSVRVITSSKDVSSATDLRLVVDNNIDLAVAEDAATGEIKAAIKVAAYDQGALLGYLPLQEVKFNNAPVSNVSGSSVEVPLTEVTSGTSVYIAKYAAGTYPVYVKTTSGKTFNGSITLKNSTVPAVVTQRIANEFAGAIDTTDKAGSAKAAIAACLKISYKAPVDLTVADNLYVKDSDVVLTNKSVFVKTAYVKYTTTGGAQVWIPVEINMTFTVK